MQPSWAKNAFLGFFFFFFLRFYTESMKVRKLSFWNLLDSTWDFHGSHNWAFGSLRKVPNLAKNSTSLTSIWWEMTVNVSAFFFFSICVLNSAYFSSTTCVSQNSDLHTFNFRKKKKSNKKLVGIYCRFTELTATKEINLLHTACKSMSE